MARMPVTIVGSSEVSVLAGVGAGAGVAVWTSSVGEGLGDADALDVVATGSADCAELVGAGVGVVVRVAIVAGSPQPDAGKLSIPQTNP